MVCKRLLEEFAGATRTSGMSGAVSEPPVPDSWEEAEEEQNAGRGHFQAPQSQSHGCPKEVQSDKYDAGSRAPLICVASLRQATGWYDYWDEIPGTEGMPCIPSGAPQSLPLDSWEDLGSSAAPPVRGLLVQTQPQAEQSEDRGSPTYFLPESRNAALDRVVPALVPATDAAAAAGSVEAQQSDGFQYYEEPWFAHAESWDEGCCEDPVDEFECVFESKAEREEIRLERRAGRPGVYGELDADRQLGRGHQRNLKNLNKQSRAAEKLAPGPSHYTKGNELGVHQDFEHAGRLRMEQTRRHERAMDRKLGMSGLR